MQMLQLCRLDFSKIQTTIAIGIFERNFLMTFRNESRIVCVSLLFKKRRDQEGIPQ